MSPFSPARKSHGWFLKEPLLPAGSETENKLLSISLALNPSISYFHGSEYFLLIYPLSVLGIIRFLQFMTVWWVQNVLLWRLNLHFFSRSLVRLTIVSYANAHLHFLYGKCLPCPPLLLLTAYVPCLSSVEAFFIYSTSFKISPSCASSHLLKTIFKIYFVCIFMWVWVCMCVRVSVSEWVCHSTFVWRSENNLWNQLSSSTKWFPRDSNTGSWVWW